MTGAQTTSSTPQSHPSEPSLGPRGTAIFILAVLVIIAALVYGAFMIGPWIIGITALATVPVIYVVLILISVGR